MKATVTQLISGEGYTDKQRRVQLTFKDASCGFNEIRVPVAALGVEGVALDDVLDVRISRVDDVKRKYMETQQAKSPVAEGNW